jgi:tetratricopeptide (TPR) repeat protein
MKKFLVFALLVLLAFCAPRKKVEISVQAAGYENKIKEADNLFRQGSYFCLKEALLVYRDFLSAPRYGKQVKEKFIKTALLLTLREKELGFLEYKSFEEALNIIQKTPSLSGFSIYLDIVNSIPRTSKGTIADSPMDGSQFEITHDRLKKNVPLWINRLKEQYAADEFHAYLYLALSCSLPHYSAEEKPDFSGFAELFSNSPLIQYKLSICPKENEDRLNELLDKEPLFYEAYYFLGEIALKQGQLVSAEKNFLKACEHIPESSTAIISLASIYFVSEEITKSLEFYEQALRMAPEYRDALLGKALCLSYSGKNEEAIEICQKLISLGSYLMGESHYWLAWNQNELERLDEAWLSIENAKKYLIGNSEVLTLSGIIAYKRKDLEQAEKNLLEAIGLNAFNCEANLYLGNIYAERQDWKNSGLYFSRAASCYERVEKSLGEKIKEIENSSFSLEREEKLIAKKKAQLKKTSLTKATSFYHGAAGYFKAGMNEEALTLAQKAERHSALKDRAKELINKIKEIKEAIF